MIEDIAKTPHSFFIFIMSRFFRFLLSVVFTMTFFPLANTQ